MSGFDPQWFVVSSTQAHQANFRFRVRICDAIGTVLREFRHAKHPVYGTLFFNPSPTIENYLSYDVSNLIAGTLGWQKSVNCHMEYFINIAEEYGPDANSIVVGASGDSNHIKAINSAQDFQNWSDHSVNNDRIIFIGTGTDTKFLTNQPARIPIKMGDSYELGVATHVSSVQGIHRLHIRTYDESNNLLKTAMINNPFGAMSATDQQFLSILCGPANLNSTTLSVGVQPLIQDSTAYYTIEVINSFGTAKTELKRFDIDRRCTRTGSYNRMFWLNPLGRFDAFNFTQVVDDLIETEQATYSRLLGVQTQTSITYTKSQVEISEFYASSRQSYKLRAFVNSEQAIWLKELVQSPRRYLVIDGVMIPVTMKTKSYQAKKTLQEKLIRVEFEVEISTEIQRQRL